MDAENPRATIEMCGHSLGWFSSVRSEGEGGAAAAFPHPRPVYCLMRYSSAALATVTYTLFQLQFAPYDFNLNVLGVWLLIHCFQVG